MNSGAAANERLTELLVDQALEGLSPEQDLELESLLAAGGEPDMTYGLAAAVLELALMRPGEFVPCPGRVRRRLERAGRQWAEGTASVMRTPRFSREALPEMGRLAARVIFKGGPWIAVAASLVLAVVAWWMSKPAADITGAVDSDPSREVMRFAAWGESGWPGIEGECVWCERTQKGYLRLVGLPLNDPSREQYQLWIIDERGMEQRISGGVFDAAEDGVTVVPIRPGIAVRNVRAFAVTVEEPGGTWVSDLSRRVGIASR
jgi:hypothetical protein